MSELVNLLSADSLIRLGPCSLEWGQGGDDGYTDLRTDWVTTVFVALEMGDDHESRRSR